MEPTLAYGTYRFVTVFSMAYLRYAANRRSSVCSCSSNKRLASLDNRVFFVVNAAAAIPLQQRVANLVSCIAVLAMVVCATAVATMSCQKYQQQQLQPCIHANLACCHRSMQCLQFCCQCFYTVVDMASVIYFLSNFGAVWRQLFRAGIPYTPVSVPCAPV